MNNVIAITVISFALSGCAVLQESNTISTADGRYSYIVSGQGKPAVILEAGLGDGKESWSPVFHQLAQFTRVFAYDRAGYGSSRSNNANRDGKTIVSELHSILQAASIAPPYLLVGHSIGGTYMELYARTYPNEVAGVVLVDSRHPKFDQLCEEGSASSCKFPALLAALLPPAAKQELKASSAAMQQVNESPPFPKVPLFVLTGTNKPLEKAQFKQVWLETQNDLATLSPIAKHVVCDQCGHYVQRDDSTAVIDAIQWVIKKIME